MAKSTTTLKKGDSLPGRGMSNKNRILEAFRLESFESLNEKSTRDECEVAYFRCIVKKAKDPEDKDSGMMLKLLGDKGWSSMKPTLGCVEFEFPTEGTPVTKAMAIVNAMAKGKLSPDVGTLMIGIIKDSVIIEEGTDLKARIEELEKAYNV
jgi:hypothetical protein